MHKITTSRRICSALNPLAFLVFRSDFNRLRLVYTSQHAMWNPRILLETIQDGGQGALSYATGTRLLKGRLS